MIVQYYYFSFFIKMVKAIHNKVRLSSCMFVTLSASAHRTGGTHHGQCMHTHSQAHKTTLYFCGYQCRYKNTPKGLEPTTPNLHLWVVAKGGFNFIHKV